MPQKYFEKLFIYILLPLHTPRKKVDSSLNTQDGKNGLNKII